MDSKNYKLKPDLGTIKQGFSLEDESGNVVCRAKMTKFKWFGPSPFEFVNNVTNNKEEHMLGKVLTQEESGLVGAASVKSSFKYDGKKIWDYLHELGVRINSGLSDGKIGMTYDISLEGKPLATISSSTSKGKSLITTNLYYDVICTEKDLDLVFLVALSIARTEQLFYD